MLYVPPSTLTGGYLDMCVCVCVWVGGWVGVRTRRLAAYINLIF